jgi:NAD(P)-dependent dehydrogenase (short-subunit alcohol dehydrogenase family)
VVVSDIDEGGGRETVRLIESAGGRASFLHADVGIETKMRGLIDFAEQTYGGLDVIVNRSGPYFHGAKLERWFDTVQANLLGTMYGTLFAIEAMRKRGGGAIVNFGSTSALGHGWKHCASPAYDVAKAGIARLTTTLAWLREKENIRVNCIVPDWVATDEVRSYVDTLKPEERAPNGVPEVLTTLDEIAEAVLRLATDESMAGRVMVWWSGEKAGLIPVGDQGYQRLE